ALQREVEEALALLDDEPRGPLDRRRGEADEQHGERHDEAGEGPRRADVEERVARPDAAGHADDRAHRPDVGDEGRRDEERERRGDAVEAGGDVVTELVAEEDREQRDGVAPPVRERVPRALEPAAGRLVRRAGVPDRGDGRGEEADVHVPARGLRRRREVVVVVGRRDPRGGAAHRTDHSSRAAPPARRPPPCAGGPAPAAEEWTVAPAPHGPSGRARSRRDRGGGAVYRGRFAPSPTGPPHLGGAATALVCAAAARRAGGRLVLRVEDLDPPRVVEGAERAIADDLAWLGVRFDEGPVEGGVLGPYRQSE